MNPNAPSTPSGSDGPPTSPATTYSVTGHVTETAPTETKPVPSASVSLLNGDGSRVPGAFTMTDDSGGFTLAGVPGGNRTLIAEADGYASGRQTLAVTTNLDAVQLHLDPQGTQTLRLTAPCGKPSQSLTFSVHNAGSVLVEGTARDFQIDWIFLNLSLDGQTHIADTRVAIISPGVFVQLPANVPVEGMYRASITLDTCYPVELRVTAPR